jgi:putative transposase
VFRTLCYLLYLRLLGVLTPRDRLIERLQTELLVARQQKAVLYRHVKRPVYNERDRVVLAALSRVLSRERWGAFMVTPATLLAWHRRFVARKWTRPHRPPGRPSLAPDVQALIVKMARENPRWGYQRIKGEMGKLGVHVSATAIAMLLRRKGIGPGPRRGPTWRQFLKAQAAGIIACDFFTVESAFLRSFYVLFFIELSSRRVHVTTATRHPDSPWVTQQARNLAMGFHDAGIQMRFLIRDRDCKFSASFDEVFETEGIRIIRTPIRAPNANAHAERWVQTLRAECLDFSLIVSEAHLDRVLRTYVHHYNRARPHRALGLLAPEGTGATAPVKDVPAIHRRDVLGGLIHEYSRAA